jgi:hypothetical protein
MDQLGDVTDPLQALPEMHGRVNAEDKEKSLRRESRYSTTSERHTFEVPPLALRIEKKEKALDAKPQWSSTMLLP